MTFYSKFIVLALLIISLLGGTAAALLSLQEITDKSTSETNLKAWSLVQVELEYAKFCNELQLYQQGKDNGNDLLMAYDIAWNRMDVFLHGTENADIRSRHGAQPLVEKVSALLQKNQNLIDKLPPPESERMRSWTSELLAMQQPLHQLTIDNFVEPNPAQSIIDKNVQQVTIVLLILAVITLGTFLQLFYETRRHWYLSYHDHLTGLTNRVHFLKQLNKLCPQHGSTPYSLCLIDVMQFHEINNLFGYQSGDSLLRSLSTRLCQMMPKGMPLARVGSSEFAALLPTAESEKLLSEILMVLQETLLEYDPSQRLHLCCGISHYPEHTKEANELFQFADMALAESKHPGVISPQSFTGAMQEKLSRRRALATKLRSNLVKNSPDLYLNYQPIHTLKSENQLGVEALLRWKDPDLGFIPPPEVIDIAEEHGLGEALGDWIFQRIAEDLKQVPLCYHPLMTISINLSQSLFVEALIDKVQAFLELTSFQSEQVVLELTETIVLHDSNASIQLLNKLRDTQFKIALDDFGTGLSSLAYLRNLPVDFLKIDKSFIKNIDKTKQQLHFIWHIAELAHVLNLQVVVEGVETQAEFDSLKLLDIEKVQGYYFSKPLMLGDLVNYLASFFPKLQQPA